MDSLSSELKTMIVNALLESDLPNTRLVCQSLSRPATQRLFSQIHATPQEDSHTRFHSILNSELCSLVTRIQLTTSDEPYEDEYEEPNDFTEEFEEVFQSICQFPNLQDVAVEFSTACMIEDDDDNGWHTDVAETAFFRYEVLNYLFNALNDKEHPTPKLRSLTLKHLQDYNDERIVTSPSFAAVLSRIQELRLKIVTEYDSASPESSWDIPHMYTFFADLPSIWLKPTEANLTSLCIHADIYWGYIPKCDFRSLHFPNLKKLELGNHTFCISWQMEWIFSHAQSLEKLVLDDCHILSYVYGYGLTDKENFPLQPYGVQTMEKYRCKYFAKWDEYFGAIEKKLPKLRQFVFGHGDWHEGRNFDGAEMEVVGLHEEMYYVFDKGTGPSPWMPVAGYVDYRTVEDGDDGWTQMEPSHIKLIADQDRKAYDQLMKTLKERK